MYMKRIYSPINMLRWTRQETVLFIVIAAVPVLLYDALGQHWLRLPWLPIALIGTAVAFILGFQNNASYARTWEARKIWGGIVNTSRAWAIMVIDFITNDFTDENASDDELRQIKRVLIFRHIAWLTALRHAMRQDRPWEHFASHPTNRRWTEAMQVREHTLSLDEELTGYLDHEESAQIRSKTNLPTQILALQSSHLRRLRTRSLIDDFRHMEMERVLVDLLAVQGKSERIKNFPYPRQYATLNAMFVWIFILLLPFGLTPVFGEIGSNIRDANPWMGRVFIWLSVPLSAVVMWVFHTMERIGRVTENPFEGSPNDVPITAMSRGIEIDLREMLGDDPDSIPAPIEPRLETLT